MSLRNWFGGLAIALAIGLVIGFALVGAGRVLAQNGLTVNSWTADSGGGTLSGGTFKLSSTAGQPDAGLLTGGTFRLYGGFWGPAGADQPGVPETHEIYLPAITTQ